MFNVKSVVMDSKKQNIIKLWQYLDIQDEHLIVQVGNEELLLICKNDHGELISTHINLRNANTTLTEWIAQHGHPFILIRQRNKNGTFIIPDTDKWKIDEESDY